MKNPQAAERTLPEAVHAERAAGYWLLAAAIVVLLPHVVRLPIWLGAVLGALFGWRFLIMRRAWAMPGRWLRIGLTLLIAGLLFRRYGTLFGRDAGSALLAAMLALKLLELRAPRDYIVGVLLVYFLILIGFLYSQSIWLVGYLVAVFVLTSATLVRLAVPGARPRFALRLAGVLVLQALPLMVVMHLLFPRLQGSLWRLPQDAYTGVTGMSEVMRPGSIRDLSLSDDVAFRVDFAGPPPRRAQQYWRTLVLWRYDGRAWRRGFEPPANLAYDISDTALPYTLILEPSNKPWLPALDLPARVPGGTRLHAGFILESEQPLRARQRFSMAAHLRYRVRHLTADERRASLQQPAPTSSRIQALVRGWRQSAVTDAGVVRAALAYFHEENFYYTLQPPLLGDNPVEEFLFDTRRGFCEHYASAFVVLMRAAGIPARVVAGYQGGEFNPVGNYMIVRQSDAHAWAEVWLPGEGWVRVDPTAAVAPERIEYGADALQRLFARGETPGRLAPAELAQALALNWPERMGREARMFFDDLNTGWQRWVLDYGASRQRDLLARLGIADVRAFRLAGWMAGSIILLMLLYSLSTWQRRPRPDPLLRAYRKFCRRLARAGVVRAPAEGALAFGARGGELRPDLAEPIQAITDLYVRLRYGDESAPAQSKELRRLVARFRPQRAPDHWPS
jgi:transglutaminase-like putative cysteine protease